MQKNTSRNHNIRSFRNAHSGALFIVVICCRSEVFLRDCAIAIRRSGFRSSILRLANNALLRRLLFHNNARLFPAAYAWQPQEFFRCHLYRCVTVTASSTTNLVSLTLTQNRSVHSSSVFSWFSLFLFLYLSLSPRQLLKRMSPLLKPENQSAGVVRPGVRV